MSLHWRKKHLNDYNVISMFIVIVRRTGRRKIILNRHDRGWKLVDKIVCRQIQMSWLISNARQRVRTTFFIFKFCEIGYRGFLNKVNKQTYTQTNERTNRQATKDKNKTKQDRDEKQIWDLVQWYSPQQPMITHYPPPSPPIAAPLHPKMSLGERLLHQSFK